MLHNFLINCITQFRPHFPPPICIVRAYIGRAESMAPLTTHPFYASLSNLYRRHFSSVSRIQSLLAHQWKSLVPPGISIKLSRICSCSYHDFISYDDCCCWVFVCVCVVRGPSFVIVNVLIAFYRKVLCVWWPEIDQNMEYFIFFIVMVWYVTSISAISTTDTMIHLYRRAHRDDDWQHIFSLVQWT